MGVTDIIRLPDRFCGGNISVTLEKERRQLIKDKYNDLIFFNNFMSKS